MDKVVLSFTPSLLFFTLSLSLSHYLSPPFDLKFILLHAILALCLFVSTYTVICEKGRQVYCVIIFLPREKQKVDSWH
jgi:hypothetical protein